MSQLDSVHKKLEKLLSETNTFRDAAKQLFVEADADGNGILTPKEVASVTDRLFDSIEHDLAMYGMQFKRPTAEQIEELLREVDKDNNCVLDQREFFTFYRQVVKYYAVVAQESNKGGRSFGSFLWKIIVATAGVFGVKSVTPHVPTVGEKLTPYVETIPVLLVGPILGILCVFATRGHASNSLKDEIFKDGKKSDGEPSS
eukprot:g6872.t1